MNTLVSAYDRGFHYGDGLFETIVCHSGRAQFLTEHLERLTDGCRRLAIPFVATPQLSAQVTAAAQGVSCIIKVIVTRGESAIRGYASSVDAKPTCVVLKYPPPAVSPESKRAGVRVRLGALRLAENERLAGIKHLNRLEQVLARAEWSDADIAESLLGSRSGELISGTMSNVFLVSNNSLRTPRLDTCGVHGVMRRIVLERARAAGIHAVEAPIEWRDVSATKEAFLTSSVLGICPIRELDGRTLAIGATTLHLQSLLASWVA